MDRASRRHTGNVDRVRRFGIRPVDFVRAAERDLVAPPSGRRRSRGQLTSRLAADSRSAQKQTVSDQLGARMALRRAWR